MFTLWYLVLGYKEYNRGCRNTTQSQLSNNEKVSNEQSKVVEPEPVKKPDAKHEVPEMRPTEPVKIPERPKPVDVKPVEPEKMPERPKAQDSKPSEPPKMPERPKPADAKPVEPEKMPERPKAQDSKPSEPPKMPERPKPADVKPVEPEKMPERPKAQDSKPLEPLKMPERPKPADPKAMEPAKTQISNRKRESPEAVKPAPGSKTPHSGGKGQGSFRQEGRMTVPSSKKEDPSEPISRDDEMLGRKPGRSAGVNGAGPRQDPNDPKFLSYGFNERNPGREGNSNSNKGERSVPSSPDSLEGSEKEF